MPPSFGKRSDELRKLYDDARPVIEEQIDLTERIADLRGRATALGFDWSQIKALLKAQILDEHDDGQRVTRLLEKAGNAMAYANVLGFGAQVLVADQKVNEKNFSADNKTKDLGEPKPAEPPAAPAKANGATVGGDAELLDIPPSLWRAANSEAPAPETKDQQNDDGEPDPFDWPGGITPEAPTTETVK